MHLWDIIAELLVLLAGALALGSLFERLGQSAILGYLLAGTLLGPHVLNWVVNEELVATVSELGVALLLFTIGLEFSARRLIQTGPVALVGGTAQVVLTTGIAAGAAMAMGMDARAAVTIGAMVAMSSTACVIRVLIDEATLESIPGRSALGILLLQDIAVVPMVLMVTMFTAGGGVVDVAWGLVKSLLLIIALAGAFYLAANFLLPRLFRGRALLRNRELLVLLAIVLALGSAWAAQALGLSPALGSFIAGMLLAESPFASQVRADVGGLRVLFVTLFFTAIGMYGDPTWMIGHAPQVLGLVVLVVVGKTALISLILPFFGLKPRHAIAAGVKLAQIGEFSFVIAGVAVTGGLLSDEAFRLFVSATLITLFLTPYMVTSAHSIGGAVERLLPRRWRSSEDHHDGHPVGHEPMVGHIVVIGFGTAGQLAAETLVRGGTAVLIVDLSHANVALARERGLAAQFGDATGADALRHACVDAAAAVVITLPDYHSVRTAIHLVRAQAPGVPIVVRCRYHIYADEIRRAGPDLVVDEERQIGHKLGRAVRRYLRREGSTAPPG